ncbi:GNAT family N-acetyltransferase [Streptomyces sp. XH2]|uniref:GNAT family N-acetyltransferase n=1 Tax=Streptomyces sp. XH2 TaxID=3412483 RepID=UPI003C7EC8DD
MPIVRRAIPDDAPELVRLRRIMLDATSDRPTPDGPWTAACEKTVATMLMTDTRFAMFVIDAADGRLAACSAASYTPRFPTHYSNAPWHGEIHQVVTDPEYRRLGYARRTTHAARDWLAAQGCASVWLIATADGRGLYEELGFRTIPWPRMVWRP